MEFEQIELTMMISVLGVCGIGLGVERVWKWVKKVELKGEFDPEDLLPPPQRACDRECFRDDIR